MTQFKSFDAPRRVKPERVRAVDKCLLWASDCNEGPKTLTSVCPSLRHDGAEGLVSVACRANGWNATAVESPEFSAALQDLTGPPIDFAAGRFSLISSSGLKMGQFPGRTDKFAERPVRKPYTQQNG